MRLAGKVALVTGGARGIGRGIALALAGEGADVAIAEIDRVPDAANQYGATAVGGLAAARDTVRELTQLGRRALAIDADVTQAAQVERMERRARDGALLATAPNVTGQAIDVDGGMELH